MLRIKAKGLCEEGEELLEAVDELLEVNKEPIVEDKLTELINMPIVVFFSYYPLTLVPSLGVWWKSVNFGFYSVLVTD